MNKPAFAAAALFSLILTGCGGVFDSKIAAPQTYVLRLPPQAAVEAGAPRGSRST